MTPHATIAGRYVRRYLAYIHVGMAELEGPGVAAWGWGAEKIEGLRGSYIITLLTPGLFPLSQHLCELLGSMMS